MDVVDQTSSSRTSGLGTELPRQFKTMIVHEDPDTATRAQAAFERLALQFAEHGTTTCDLWRFDVLADARLRDRVSEQASDADLVIVSGHASAALPNAVKNWIWTWLPARRASSGALALLFDDCVECEQGRRPNASPVCVALRRAAASGQMDFVCSRPAWQRTSEELYLQQMRQRVHQTSSVLEDILGRRGTPHWGLNE
jgi:hypothetical protein